MTYKKNDTEAPVNWLEYFIVGLGEIFGGKIKDYD